jgi:hypothetical protein
MPSKKVINSVTENQIVEKIFYIRGMKVMLDRDLAEMYGVPTHRLNESVKRNISRFPDDFMFQLSEEEFKNLKFQNGISSWGGVRRPPYAFTEQGVAMLSSVLRSEIAIQVNIRIIRVYTQMRQMLLDNKELWQKIESIESKLMKKDEEIQGIFKILKQLLVKPEKPREPIGFKIPKRKS